MHLVTCNDADSVMERLKIAVQEMSVISERATNITPGCESATPGRFPAIVLTPIRGDRSWGQLVDLASHYEGLGFVVVLVASSVDLNHWVEALGDRSPDRDELPLKQQPARSLGTNPQDAEDDWSC
jgi:hypothetical protein